MYIEPSQLTTTERAKIINFLQAHPVGVLATVTEDGDPHASAIYVNTDDDLRITFTTKHDTLKYKNIGRHDTVMVVVFEAETQTSVTITGKAIEVHDDQDERHIYRETLHAAEQTGTDVVPPIAKIPAGKYVGFEINVSAFDLSEYGWGDTFKNALAHASETNTIGDPD